jgi:hypothetical protein
VPFPLEDFRAAAGRLMTFDCLLGQCSQGGRLQPAGVCHHLQGVDCGPPRYSPAFCAQPGFSRLSDDYRSRFANVISQPFPAAKSSSIGRRSLGLETTRDRVAWASGAVLRAACPWQHRTTSPWPLASIDPDYRTHACPPTTVILLHVHGGGYAGTLKPTDYPTITPQIGLRGLITSWPIPPATADGTAHSPGPRS